MEDNFTVILALIGLGAILIWLDSLANSNDFFYSIIVGAFFLGCVIYNWLH